MEKDKRKGMINSKREKRINNKWNSKKKGKGEGQINSIRVKMVKKMENS